MSILEQARLDTQQITSNQNDFGVVLSFVAPDLSTATIAGLHTKIHEGYDANTGQRTIKKQAHISFSEALLTALSYPVRNGSGEVAMQGHKVTVKDSTGIEKEYVINDPYADETLGLIKCYLGSFE